jgi:hypothetical protein
MNVAMEIGAGPMNACTQCARGIVVLSNRTVVKARGKIIISTSPVLGGAIKTEDSARSLAYAHERFILAHQ